MTDSNGRPMHCFNQFEVRDIDSVSIAQLLDQRERCGIVESESA